MKKNRRVDIIFHNSLRQKNIKQSFKKLAIALPVDSKIYKKKLIFDSLKTIFDLNFNYSLYIIYNRNCPKIKAKKNIFLIKMDFDSLSKAFNIVLDSINYNEYDYITFLTPGDLLLPSTYDFLNYIEEHDIYQVLELNKMSAYEIKSIVEEQNYTLKKITYDLINEIPNNNYAIFDKIYKISILKKRNITFIEHEKSLFYFNLLFFLYSKDLLFINSYGIMHKEQFPSGDFINNTFHEINIFKKIFSSKKHFTKKNIEEINKIDYNEPY